MSHRYGLMVLTAIATLAISGCDVLFTYPLKTVHVTERVAGNFTIGETKEMILSRLPGETFSPLPKAVACRKNWLDVSTLTETERTCLLKSDTWEEGSSSTRASCPEKRVDVRTTLRFKNEKLFEVVTECWRPQ
jgi:hypothetical protein